MARDVSNHERLIGDRGDCACSSGFVGPWEDGETMGTEGGFTNNVESDSCDLSEEVDDDVAHMVVTRCAFTLCITAVECMVTVGINDLIATMMRALLSASYIGAHFGS